MQYPETSIDCLFKNWDVPVYVFYKSTPNMEYFNNHKAHVFECAASPCHLKTRFVRRFLYTGDTSSTSNPHRHARVCWGDEALAATDQMCDVKTAHEALRNHNSKNGSITAAFKHVGTGRVTYSHRQHTRIEAYRIVNDRAFCCLMKTGRPDYYIPSVEVLSHDVKNVFVRVCERIVKFQEIDGKLSFATDAWTSPNYKVYIAITVHFERNGTPMALLLDLVEVPKFHTGVNMANAFADVLEAFGVKD
ncbi:hypothetical protein BJY52DRAFT_1204843 [Lactarius psammicola]|nr:hypothetical protein BJY52DRAFT_1204843 [Lactarius psammicola]